MSVLLETTQGDIVIDLFIKERPSCCRNFLKLCKTKYYNLCQVFTIEENYMFQTGDPTNTGRGGESIYGQIYGDQARYFEIETLPKIRHLRKGIVSFVNNGSDMLGSQFFITLADNLDYLDNKHCVFGQVAEGMDTLDNINAQICDEENRPFNDIRIAHTIVLHDPFEDPPRLTIPSRSPSPTLELVQATNKIALDEKVDEDEGKTAEQIRKEMEKKQMRAQAQILEMVGDLHHADDKPPDNVLFVCKLNPVTTSEDLEMIFSRFGEIIECEVIKDRRTQDSLQYAFIEFADPKQCEAAYLKMDNVLIDDRRIHVDFSQSVAKTYAWNKQKITKENSLSPLHKRSRRERTRSPNRRQRSRTPRRREKSRSPKRRRRSPSPQKKRSDSLRKRGSRSPKRSRDRSSRKDRSKTPPRQRRRRHSSDSDSDGRRKSDGRHRHNGRDKRR